MFGKVNSDTAFYQNIFKSFLGVSQESDRREDFSNRVVFQLGHHKLLSLGRKPKRTVLGPELPTSNILPSPPAHFVLEATFDTGSFLTLVFFYL